MIADPGYDDQNLYDLSIRLGFQLECPVRRYRTTPEESCIGLISMNQH